MSCKCRPWTLKGLTFFSDTLCNAAVQLNMYDQRPLSEIVNVKVQKIPWKSPKMLSRQAFFLYALHAIYVSRISGKLSFCLFGTEFSENLKVFGQKMSEIVFFEQFLVKIFINPLFWNWVFWQKLSFWRFLGSEFLKNQNWVFWFCTKKSLC